MERAGLLVLLVVALYGPSRVDATPDGAPAGQCAAMTPNHGATKQDGLAPYTVTTATDYYMAGQRLMSKLLIIHVYAAALCMSSAEL